MIKLPIVQLRLTNFDKIEGTMTKPVLVTAAWPYANAYIHVGNLTGSYLPADIFARYQRLSGNDVLFVSGSDAHGTPITVRADAENTTPEAVYKRFHDHSWKCRQKSASVMTCLPVHILKTISKFRRMFSSC